jgi:hypothetical protein
VLLFTTLSQNIAVYSKKQHTSFPDWHKDRETDKRKISNSSSNKQANKQTNKNQQKSAKETK